MSRTRRSRIRRRPGGAWWKWLGVAGLAGVAATGAAAARAERQRRSVTPAEARERLRQRVREAGGHVSGDLGPDGTA